MNRYAYADAGQTERTSAGSTTFVDSALGPARSTTGSTSTYFVRDSVGGLVARVEGSARHYYLLDRLGSVVGLAKTDGTLANTYAYDPYGQRLSVGEAVANPWQFAGGVLAAVVASKRSSEFGPFTIPIVIVIIVGLAVAGWHWRSR